LRRLPWVLLVCGVGVLLYLFPPLRIVPLDVAKQQRESEAFHPEAFAREFWNNRLMASLGQAVEASKLFAAIDQDPKTAKKKYARTWGLGSVYYYYFVAGVGRVVSRDGDSVSLSLGGDSAADITIATSRIFGNAIRNGTGLIDVSDFPNSQNLNNISLEINRIVEARVLPPFREQVAVGLSVKFVGCAEIMDKDSDLYPMRLIPILLEVQQKRGGV